MSFVLDASVTVSWALLDESNDFALSVLQRMGGEAVFAPSLWWYEVRNVLLLAERRGRIAAADVDEFLVTLNGFRIDCSGVPVSPLVSDLVRRQRLSAYDAAYLALAITHELPLATLDRALLAASRAEGVTLLA